jgi:hypothetical protein
MSMAGATGFNPSLWSINYGSPLSWQGIGARFAILAFALSPLIRVVGANVIDWDWLQCPILYFTGVPCPSCGMTRAFLAIAQGDFSGAIAFHLFSPLIFACFLGLAGHLIVEIVKKRRISTSLSRFVLRSRTLVIFLLCVLLYHSVRLFHLWSTGELVVAVQQAPLYLWLTSAS